VELLGVYPTAESLAAQGVLLALLAAALWRTFGRRSAGALPESGVRSARPDPDAAGARPAAGAGTDGPREDPEATAAAG
jgi:hypothetical protein